jgi:hypothetical protein
MNHRWFSIDGARQYLTREGERPPSRKVIYSMVADGMRVSRHGRRIWFCAEWVDEFMEKKASAAPARVPQRQAS